MKKPAFFQKVILLLSLTVTLHQFFLEQQFLTQINGWNAYVHLPWDYNSNNNTYPTIIFYPGIGEVGTNPAQVIKNGPGAYIAQGWNGNVKVGADSVKFIVISVQPSTAWPGEYFINQSIQSLKSLYRINNQRLYLTGLSMGGWCATTYVTADPAAGPYTYASQVAAIVDVEGVKPDDNQPYPNLFDNFAATGGRYVGFEQAYDFRDKQTVVNRMNATRPNSAIYVQTSYGSGGHCCWEQFYGGSGAQPNVFNLDGISQNIYQWFARQNAPVVSAPVNQLPVANAGADIVINAPSSTASISGSATDADGTIASYSWTKLSGPTGGIIANGTSAVASLTGLVAGTYQFVLTVTDNAGGVSTDTVTVIVNKPPVVNAGVDQVISLPTVIANLSGSATDADGSVVSYTWSKMSGPATGLISSVTSAITTITSLVQGSYSLVLTARDNYGATASDTVVITVNPLIVINAAPVANAGADQTITLPASSVSVAGSGTDSDGTVGAYQWSLVSGPSTPVFSNSTAASSSISGLVQGSYVIRLKVTDNAGATATDDMVIKVNVAPVANAGVDQTITLPTSSVSVTGSGTDIDGTVSAYQWSLVSGPSTPTVSNLNAANSTISALVQGTYVFRLKVTDNVGAIATDDMVITVNAAVVATPAATKSIRVNINNGKVVYSNAQWNNWNTANSLTSATLLYDDQTASTVTAVLSQQAGLADNGASYAAATTVCPADVVRIESYNTSNRTLTINGLKTTSKYTLQFFASRANTGNKTVFQIGSVRDTIATDGNISDFVKLVNIVPSASGSVVVDVYRIGTYNYIGGFIITEQSAGTAAKIVAPANSSLPAVVSKPVEKIAVESTATITAFPNPASSNLQLRINNTVSNQAGVIRITDLQGRSMYNLQFTTRLVNQFTINVDQFKAGMYIITYTVNGVSTVQKVIKQ